MPPYPPTSPSKSSDEPSPTRGFHVVQAHAPTSSVVDVRHGSLGALIHQPCARRGRRDGHDHSPAPHYLADVNNNGVADWRDWDCKGDELCEDTFQLESILKHAFNFVLLIALLTYAVRQPLSNYLSERAKTIRAELEDGQALLDAAKAREQEIAGRLAKLEATLAQISADADEAAAKDKASFLERARAKPSASRER